jgi:hypothetical protein
MVPLERQQMSPVKRTHFIAIGNTRSFGRATSIKEAKANMISEAGRVNKPTSWRVYQATEQTYVNDMGGLNRPGDHPPAIIVESTEAGDTVVPIVAVA